MALMAAISLHHAVARAGPATVNLGSDSDFAILAGSAITFGGTVNSSTITGNIGSYPTPAITGLGNAVLNGVNQTGNAGLMLNAQNDLTTAFNNAAGRPVDGYYPAITDLGGLTLVSGVYNDPSSFGITGTLTLNAAGNPDAVWIFQMGSTLTTATGSSVVLENGAQACHVFWEVGSSATLGVDSTNVGTIMASSAITLDTGAVVNGRLLAENADVTLDGYNTVIKPVCRSSSSVPDSSNTFLLCGLGLAALCFFGQNSRRFA
jgi:hypothetical protein